MWCYRVKSDQDALLISWLLLHSIIVYVPLHSVLTDSFSLRYTKLNSSLLFRETVATGTTRSTSPSMIAVYAQMVIIIIELIIIIECLTKNKLLIVDSS